MAAILVFFLSVFNFAWLASFRLNILLNFSLKNEASQANLNTEKIAAIYKSGPVAWRYEFWFSSDFTTQKYNLFGFNPPLTILSFLQDEIKGSKLYKHLMGKAKQDFCNSFKEDDRCVLSDSVFFLQAKALLADSTVS